MKDSLHLMMWLISSLNTYFFFIHFPSSFHLIIFNFFYSFYSLTNLVDVIPGLQVTSFLPILKYINAWHILPKKFYLSIVINFLLIIWLLAIFLLFLKLKIRQLFLINLLPFCQKNSQII